MSEFNYYYTTTEPDSEYLKSDFTRFTTEIHSTYHVTKEDLMWADDLGDEIGEDHFRYCGEWEAFPIEVYLYNAQRELLCELKIEIEHGDPVFASEVIELEAGE